MASHENASWTSSNPQQQRADIEASVTDLAIGHRFFLVERYQIAPGQMSGTVAFRTFLSQKCIKCAHQGLRFTTTVRKSGLEIRFYPAYQATRWSYKTQCSCENPFCNAEWLVCIDSSSFPRYRSKKLTTVFSSAIPMRSLSGE